MTTVLLHCGLQTYCLGGGGFIFFSVLATDKLPMLIQANSKTQWIKNNNHKAMGAKGGGDKTLRPKGPAGTRVKMIREGTNGYGALYMYEII